MEKEFSLSRRRFLKGLCYTSMTCGILGLADLAAIQDTREGIKNKVGEKMPHHSARVVSFAEKTIASANSSQDKEDDSQVSQNDINPKTGLSVVQSNQILKEQERFKARVKEISKDEFIGVRATGDAIATASGLATAGIKFLTNCEYNPDIKI